MEKQDKLGALAYEPPRIVDYGDLVELTAGGGNCIHPNAYLNKPGCPPPKFS